MWSLADSVKILLLPPLSLFALAMIGGLVRLRAPRLGRSLVIAAWLLLYAVNTPLVSAVMLRSLESAPAAPLDRAGEAGAIVVLSANLNLDAPEYDGETVGTMTLERLRYGAWLQRQTGLPLLVSGGYIEGALQPLATAMRDVLVREFGVAVRWVEDRSHSTFENATMSARLLRADGVGTVFLVTHAWHIPRAQAAFAAAGLKVIPAPTMFTPWPGLVPTAALPASGALQRSAFALYEWLGLAWYRLVYF